MPRSTANLELSIEVGSDPISGSVSQGASGSQPFNGWIELVAAIEAARTAGHGGADWSMSHGGTGPGWGQT